MSSKMHGDSATYAAEQEGRVMSEAGWGGTEMTSSPEFGVKMNLKGKAIHRLLLVRNPLCPLAWVLFVSLLSIPQP